MTITQEQIERAEALGRKLEKEWREKPFEAYDHKRHRQYSIDLGGTHKRCSACGENKPRSEFRPRSAKCKACRYKVNRAWLARQREKKEQDDSR